MKEKLQLKQLKQAEEKYYKPKRVNSFWNNNQIKYEINGHNNWK